MSNALDALLFGFAVANFGFGIIDAIDGKTKFACASFVIAGLCVLGGLL